ncbi:hypothetical protein HOS07_gp38 [Cronobacter phage ESSI-2]|uniref:Uncharacterized protein n=1 Tax=Cronobacter phage ESSI-2 TaxID=947842 RepID=F1BUN4_9CAUD|nr:hypothetical protein HOS07_gp38 [Cronobacter phage ESSI-2]ADX32404.1 hypothetical protein [Cronobacter phage ESSI-2]
MRRRFPAPVNLKPPWRSATGVSFMRVSAFEGWCKFAPVFSRRATCSAALARCVVMILYPVPLTARQSRVYRLRTARKWLLRRRYSRYWSSVRSCITTQETEQ